MKIKLIYGSDTGNTEIISNDLSKLFEDIEIISVDELDDEIWLDNDKFILGIPTWYDGELQSDWENYFDEFQEIDFTNKTVGIFGLGDQFGYEEWVCDGIGILGKVVLENGGKLIGFTKKDNTYDFDTEPKSLMDSETFYGLCLDEDNQPELTKDRLENWVENLKEQF